VAIEEEFEDTKRVIRIRKSRKGRQRNGQQKKDIQRSTNHTHKTKDRATRAPPPQDMYMYGGFILTFILHSNCYFNICNPELE
jgi:hypothetical protein